MIVSLPLAAFLLAQGLAPDPPRLPPEIEYTIELATEAELSVAFSVSSPADDDGTTVFEIDESWGGVDDAAALVLDVAVADARGKTLAVEQPKPHQWLVHAPAGERLTATWRLAPNGYQADPDPRVHYHPILSSSLLHLIGNLGLLAPTHEADERPRRIAVRWKGFREKGWTVASSFSLDPEGFEVLAPLHDVRHAVYLAGALRTREVQVRGRPVGVAIAGGSWSFEDEAFVESVRSIVEAERAFFDDDEFEFYLVSLIPVGVPSAQSRSLGGTGLTQSFALFLQPDTQLGASASGTLSVPGLLAHEMFHHWNGRVIGRADPEELVYWFSEGFTDFFGRRLMLRAGYGGIAEYERNLNRTLRDYALSPAREATNEAIRTGFWKDRDVGQMPYLRGDVVAMLLDREIRVRSGGGRSLDDFLRELVARGRRGERVSTESLLARIEEWTDADFARRMRGIVVEGRIAEIPPETFAPCFEVFAEESAAFDAGFDVEATRRDKVVRGVKKGSAAEKAGLREGQALAGWSVAIGQPDVPIEMTVREDGQDRVIRWLPKGAPVSVTQVRAVAGDDCSRM
jgi:predicted metalloprotease with PDZ domain